MAKASRKKELFDFENAQVGQPGPNGSPILRTFVNPQGIPGVETRDEKGRRVLSFPLAALRRQPFTRITPPPPKPVPEHQPARIAELLAQAHRLQQALDDGEHDDQAALARAFGLSRARVSQLLDLTLLAPDIQEEILFLERGDQRERALTDRAIQALVRQASWSAQRRLWRGLVAPTA